MKKILIQKNKILMTIGLVKICLKKLWKRWKRRKLNKLKNQIQNIKNKKLHFQSQILNLKKMLNHLPRKKDEIVENEINLEDSSIKMNIKRRKKKLFEDQIEFQDLTIENEMKLESISHDI